MCPQVGSSFPALSHLSLFKTLVSEVEPAFRSNSLAVARYRNAHRRGALSTLPAAKVPGGGARSGSHQGSSTGSCESPKADASGADTDDGDGSDDSEDSAAGPGGGAARADASPPNDYGNSRYAEYLAEHKATKDAALATVPPHTSAAGWAALLRGLPCGLFSLDVRGCDLSYPSYALLHERVSELQAAKVLSPEVIAAAAARRRAKAKEQRDVARAEAASASGAAAAAGTDGAGDDLDGLCQ